MCKRIMIIVLTVACLAVLGGVLWFQQPQWGRSPRGDRLARITASPHYRNGEFQNVIPTEMMAEMSTLPSALWEFMVGKNTPVDVIPSTTTDLFSLDPEKNVLVWFGHSSYFMQIDGRRFLVDPVFSGGASPVSCTTRAFKGTDRFVPADIPPIDYLFITHDHWDHLDYETILQLKPKVGKVICGLGVGEHFEQWGFDFDRVIERDWNEDIPLDRGFTAYTVTARHFSGRTMLRNRTLWTSFVLRTPSMQILIGGDGGYGPHFQEIGKKFGAFDLAILDNGQHHRNWRYIHMMPDEVWRAAEDLQAKRLFPAHSGKFALAPHAWDAPLKAITALRLNKAIQLLTPMIGEAVDLRDTTRVYPAWWQGLK
jgi:L-ascorbate metabolism protein UlaG (beta-lactamase superfamily)